MWTKEVNGKNKYRNGGKVIKSELLVKQWSKDEEW